MIKVKMFKPRSSLLLCTLRILLKGHDSGVTVARQRYGSCLRKERQWVTEVKKWCKGGVEWGANWTNHKTWSVGHVKFAGTRKK